LFGDLVRFEKRKYMVGYYVLVAWFGWLLRGVYGNFVTMLSLMESLRMHQILSTISKPSLGFGFPVVLAVKPIYLFWIGVLILWDVLLVLSFAIYCKGLSTPCTSL
jgi:hypothetical protein